jgi:hypothetical protein
MRYIFKLCMICIVLTIIIFPSCKYKDGPLISFRNADRRLQGEFQAEKFEIDGQDAMQLWQDSICNNKIVIRWHELGGNQITICFNNIGCAGRYIISDDKRNLEIEILNEETQYPGYGPFHFGKHSIWKILKLSNKEFWIETTFEGHYYYLQLNKIKDLPY